MINKKKNLINNNLEYLKQIQYNNKFNFNLFKIIIGSLIKKGLKIKATLIFIYVINKISLKFNISKKKAIMLFLLILKKLKPLLGLKTIYRSGLSYKLPCLISEKKSYSIAIKWILIYIKNQKFKISFKNKFLKEILNLIKKKSPLFKKKNEIKKIILNSRAILYFLNKRKRKFNQGSGLYSIIYKKRQYYLNTQKYSQQKEKISSRIKFAKKTFINYKLNKKI